MDLARYLPTEAVDKLGRRTTKYQFDIERDIAWDADDSDHFIPAAVMTDLGFDLTRLEATPEALAALEWSFAVGLCRTFVDGETVVVRFLEESEPELATQRSMELLSTEEKKHVALFQRMEERLFARRPEWIAPFEEVYRATAEFRKNNEVYFRRELYPTEAARHFLFWLSTIFFEEFTIYFDERVSVDPSVNALWRSAHAAHRREEVQHVATDVAYIDSLEISDDDRAAWADVMVTGIVRDLRFMAAVDAPNEFVAKLFPNVGRVLRETLPHEAPFLHDICTRPEFKRTRDYLPTLEIFG